MPAGASSESLNTCCAALFQSFDFARIDLPATPGKEHGRVYIHNYLSAGHSSWLSNSTSWCIVLQQGGQRV